MDREKKIDKRRKAVPEEISFIDLLIEIMKLKTRVDALERKIEGRELLTLPIED